MTLFSHADKLVRDTEVDRLARQTYPGQAHFAGSGQNATCRECEFFLHVATGGWYSANGKHAGAPKPACCAKFRSMTGALSAKVPHDARACKHFTKADRPQPLRRPQ